MHHFGARRRPDQMRSSTVAPLLRAVVSGGVSVAGGLYPRLVFPSGFAVGWADAAISTASRQSMPAGGWRFEAGLLYRRFSSGFACGGGWRVRFRPPLGGRCRPEAGAPRRGCCTGGSPPALPVGVVGGCDFDGLAAVDAGRRPALRDPGGQISATRAAGPRRICTMEPAGTSVEITARAMPRGPRQPAGRRAALVIRPAGAA